VETGNLTEGLKLAGEVYNSEARNNYVADTYAWCLYLSGKKQEAYDIYKNLIIQPSNLTLEQVYRSAVVIEEYDKLLGLTLYKAGELAGNNLMVLEFNVNNISAQSYITKIMDDSQKASDRLLAGGMGIDSQFRLDGLERMVKSIVQL